jgi:hypothetical protein
VIALADRLDEATGTAACVTCLQNPAALSAAARPASKPHGPSETPYIGVMRLARLCVGNFRNLRDIDIPLTGSAVLVGENATGKSNLLHARVLCWTHPYPRVSAP